MKLLPIALWVACAASAAGAGHFDVVDVMAAVPTTQDTFQQINERWLRSDWPKKRAYLWLDWNHQAPRERLRVGATAELPNVPMLFPAPGQVLREEEQGKAYRAELMASRPCYALFKASWHRNWKASLDGAAQPVVMLSPGFSGVAIGPGRHRIEMRYEASALWYYMAGACAAALAITGWLLRPSRT